MTAQAQATPKARADAPSTATPAGNPAPAPAAPSEATGSGMADSDRELRSEANVSGQTTPSPEVMAEAKQRFDRGFELYDEGEYPLALIEFNRAYELVPNYRVLYNIGQVSIQLGQYANALRALTAYRQKGGQELSQERREAVARDLQMLERRTAFLLITTNVPGAEVLVDDVSVGKTPLDPALLVDAGVHRITVRRDGYQQRTSSVTLAGGDEQTLALTLDVQPEDKTTIVLRDRPKEDNTQTLIIAGWVSTGALAAGAIVTGLMGASEAKELKRLRASEPEEDVDLASQLDSSKSKAGTLLLASDIFSGAALIVGGLSLWITLSPAEKPASTTPSDTALNLRLGYQEGQLKLDGSF
jgi:tetratricopeptide (TPR) repeat protein